MATKVKPTQEDRHIANLMRLHRSDHLEAAVRARNPVRKRRYVRASEMFGELAAVLAGERDESE